MLAVNITDANFDELLEFATSQGIDLEGDWINEAIHALLRVDLVTPAPADPRPLTGLVDELLNPDARIQLTRLKSPEEVRAARQESLDKRDAMGDNANSDGESDQLQPNSERNQDGNQG